MTNEEIKHRIIELLRSTKREGIDKLIAYMEESGFFTAPASTKYHGSYEGGLAKHSWNVYRHFAELLEITGNVVPLDSVIISALLHDLCKVGAYLGTAKPYVYNDQHPKGHALLSIERARAFIPTSSLEDGLIKYHMGPWASFEKSEKSGEFSLNTMLDVWQQYPAVKLLYFADELATLIEQSEEATC